MHWYKHQTDSLDSPFIQELLAEFGPHGYLAYYGILEIVAKAVGYNPLQKVNFSSTFLKQKLHISSGKLRQIFEFCSGKGELIFNFSKENFEFSIPKLAILKDNYSKDLQASCKKLAHHKEVEVDIEVKKKIKKKKEPIETISDGFDIFYQAYPLKVGKAAAKKAWNKITPDSELIALMVSKIEAAKKTPDWQKEKGAYIPHPATWLNGKRWEDDYNVLPEKKKLQVCL